VSKEEDKIPSDLTIKIKKSIHVVAVSEKLLNRQRTTQLVSNFREDRYKQGTYSSHIVVGVINS
jgi:hypothetical protein